MSLVGLILLLFAATAALRVLADRTGIPLPTLQVLGGLALAFVPGLPQLNLDPQTVFLVFIPPLLYWTAFTTSLRDLRQNLRAIVLLALWLVLITMVSVAYVARALLPLMPLALCFVLGAIVSPPDAVAVTAVTRRLSLPRRALVILEGESLMNDATAIVSYQVALAAAVSGSFSLPRAGLELVLTGTGGIAIGLAVGWLIAKARGYLQRASVVENTLSLLTPFVAFVPADAIGASGVLAVVATGLYLGRMAPRAVSAPTRLQNTSMWEILTFLLEGLIFILIGLELPVVVRSLASSELTHLVRVALLITVAMVVTRILWVYFAAYGIRWIERHVRHRTDPYPPWRPMLFLGWAGIRGGDSLVIALALPYAASPGAPPDARNIIIFITFVVILLTLVAQGLTMTPLIRLLGITAGPEEEEQEERNARNASLRAGAAALDQLPADSPEESRLVEALRNRSSYRLTKLDRGESTPAHYIRMRLAMLAAERDTVIRMRDRSEISDAVMARLLSEFDHEELLLVRPPAS
jgi:monovalent cation/hydrogen antiporter